METKDWIVLLVPIVINGICLFISRAPIPFPKGEMNYAEKLF